MQPECQNAQNALRTWLTRLSVAVHAVVPTSFTTCAEPFATLFAPSYDFCITVFDARPTFATGFGIAFAFKLKQPVRARTSHSQRDFRDCTDIVILRLPPQAAACGG